MSHLLVKGMQEQQAEIQTLQNTIATLVYQMETMKTQIAGMTNTHN